MGIIEQLATYLENLSQQIPVELFAFVGAFVEEAIAPIPSPLVMTLAGSIADSQGKAVMFLLWLAVLGAIGKTAGTWIVYFVADKAEDFLLGKLGRFIGVTHKAVAAWGKHFDAGGKNFLLIVVFRAIPIMPTSPVSVVAGVLKLNLMSYMSATFLGLLIRNMIYLYIGYLGYESYKSLTEGLNNIESVIQIIIGVVLVGVVGYLYYRHRKDENMGLVQRLSQKLRK